VGINKVPAHRSRLEATFERAKTVSDLQVQADLARHLCVLVAGYLEQSTRHILGEYSSEKSHPAVSRYVERRLGFFSNANCQKLCDLVGDFDAGSRVRLEEFLVGERKDAIDSVVANRHQIAHGGSVGVTLMTIQTWGERVEETVGFLTSEFS
jgi:hypothetical protein